MSCDVSSIMPGYRSVQLKSTIPPYWKNVLTENYALPLAEKAVPPGELDSSPAEKYSSPALYLDQPEAKSIELGKDVGTSCSFIKSPLSCGAGKSKA